MAEIARGNAVEGNGCSPVFTRAKHDPNAVAGREVHGVRLALELADVNGVHLLAVDGLRGEVHLMPALGAGDFHFPAFGVHRYAVSPEGKEIAPACERGSGKTPDAGA